MARAGWGALLFCITAVVVWYGSFWALQANNILISPLMPLLALTVNFSVLNLLKYWREENRAKKRTKELLVAQDFMLQCLATLAETRDHQTGGHISRTQRYIQVLCEQLAKNHKTYSFLSKDDLEMIVQLAPLHDIGKVGIPDQILLKAGHLTHDEFEVIQKHTEYGWGAIQVAEDRAGIEENPFLQAAKDIAYTHHEKWDGSGYPKGLKGKEIPISGRIMAIADVYDSLISKRVYKEPLSHEVAVEMISEGKGTQFDPDLIDVFLQIEEVWRKIAYEFADHEEEKKMLQTGQSSGTPLEKQK
jgi:response regulator RpfG family c-di-GMP phosphodiesterase